jgi:hypothetical protein
VERSGVGMSGGGSRTTEAILLTAGICKCLGGSAGGSGVRKLPENHVRSTSAAEAARLLKDCSASSKSVCRFRRARSCWRTSQRLGASMSPRRGYGSA